MLNDDMKSIVSMVADLRNQVEQNKAMVETVTKAAENLRQENADLKTKLAENEASTKELVTSLCQALGVSSTAPVDPPTVDEAAISSISEASTGVTGNAFIDGR
jgi:uncharacterized Ntn-hydrolase superfamily protein